jgi:hypothetical protein
MTGRPQPPDCPDFCDSDDKDRKAHVFRTCLLADFARTHSVSSFAMSNRLDACSTSPSLDYVADSFGILLSAGFPGIASGENPAPGIDARSAFCDNGTGLPPGLQASNTNSLGLRIVNLLGRQLRADIQETTDAGLSFSVTVPSPERSYRADGQ